MGFFSSRKAEDNDSYQVTIGVGSSADRSVVKVIRSRFYGKKGKEREDQTISYQRGAQAAAQALAEGSSAGVGSSPLTPSRRSLSGTIRSAVNERFPPTLTPMRKVNTNTPAKTPQADKSTLTPSRSRDPSTVSSASGSHANTAPTPSERPSDIVTTSLAQRLNELASANAEGLLDDDEYRLLRQNIFERFSSSTSVPMEAPVVPVTPQRRQGRASTSSDRPGSSNFQVELPRPSSTYSRASMAGVANLFRRGSKRASSKDTSDTSSIWSGTSNASNMFRIPGLKKKSSNSSIRTTASRNQVDTISISSRPLGSDRGHEPVTPARSQAGSIRRLAMPPSSFPKTLGQDSRLANPVYSTPDEDNLSTVAEIQKEIQAVEAEARRLMDAFNGLEMTTLARTQRHQTRASPRMVDLGRESGWGDSDGRSQQQDDTISMRSGTSIGTTPSVSASLARSVYSSKKPRPKISIPSSLAANPNSRPGSLHRKNSSSSVTSEWRPGRSTNAPPVPALPNGLLKNANASTVSLGRSVNQMNTVLEDEQSLSANTVRLDEDEDQDMDDIRRRREEVRQRYDARLEYLRARLKGAQLHEKLMRK